jgi:hypothetical protein
MRVDSGKHQCCPAAFVSLVNVRALLNQFFYHLRVANERRSHQSRVAMRVIVGGA